MHSDTVQIAPVNIFRKLGDGTFCTLRMEGNEFEGTAMLTVTGGQGPVRRKKKRKKKKSAGLKRKWRKKKNLTENRSDNKDKSEK